MLSLCATMPMLVRMNVGVAMSLPMVMVIAMIHVGKLIFAVSLVDLTVVNVMGCGTQS
jgi:hypothetical protein